MKVGDRIPAVTLMQMTDSGPTEVPMADYCAGRKVVLFGVPGAFTPTCSESHLPGFVEHAEALKAKGVAAVGCISTTDFFVMDAWGKSRNVGDSVDMLADGNHEFTRAAGMILDMTSRGLGERSQRYSLVVDDGVVTHLNLEDSPATADASGAAALLEML